MRSSSLSELLKQFCNRHRAEALLLQWGKLCFPHTPIQSSSQLKLAFLHWWFSRASRSRRPRHRQFSDARPRQAEGGTESFLFLFLALLHALGGALSVPRCLCCRPCLPSRHLSSSPPASRRRLSRLLLWQLRPPLRATSEHTIILLLM